MNEIGPVHLDDYATDLSPLQVRALTHSRYSETEDRYDAEVRSVVAVEDGHRVLDVGAGTGAFLAEIASSRTLERACGVDTSPESVRQMSEAGLEAHRADVCALPFEDRSFDVVFAKHMLYHASDVSRAVSELARVASAGGAVVATVNLSESQSGLTSLLRGIAAELGVPHPEELTARANEKNLEPLFEAAFEQSRVDLHQNALTFETAEPLLAYAQASLGFFGIPEGHAKRASAIELLEAKATEHFSSKGRWRDPKGFAILIGLKR